MSILKYSKFLKDLSESLDTSNVDIKWIDNTDRLIGLFKVGENTYQLDFKLTGDAWSYKFYLAKKEVNNKIELSPNATGIDTDKYVVLSTSKRGIIYLIENKSPNAIVFCALSEDEMKKTKKDDKLLTKRQSIYLNMVEQIPEKYINYTYNIDNINNNQIYVIYKLNLDDLDYTFDNVEKIINDYITDFD